MRTVEQWASLIVARPFPRRESHQLATGRMALPRTPLRADADRQALHLPHREGGHDGFHVIDLRLHDQACAGKDLDAFALEECILTLEIQGERSGPLDWRLRNAEVLSERSDAVAVNQLVECSDFSGAYDADGDGVIDSDVPV